ncbi:conserved hypothetical protein [Desulfofarcimen acetoxidans DSM 771]|uniref:Helix-turn-helix domain-containing protein n=1 Tax=Desulfofarcimen acetoxidans (strain ATCC 49208 / DSM 771 / KCTC 5769 / VKM B-1644 / 5575) TaxID=485916 RepID=C8VWP3_DESAS|nr:helix-turn-helix domain-containing protein [Desulfofarcimen acetoxidans]ACV64407.1 conserved hypothetical protein [Desulfofarcimen acetoxidans DSM 771]
MKKEAYSIPETAKILGIGRSLAYQLAREGKLKTVKLGKRLIVPAKVIEQMLSACG